MLLRKNTAPGLAHNSYFIGSGAEAVVIDPRRDIDIYLSLALEHQMEIKWIIESHKHEDFVSGAQELSESSGAPVFHGHNPDFRYGNLVYDGDTFHTGSLEMSVMETPGHTPESISVVLRDRDVSEDPLMVFTGDTLFAGDAGRTDFYGEDRRTELSTLLYESIGRIISLGDGVIICPAHGAGSVCGTAIADLEYTTVGYEKSNNPLLSLSKEEFVRVKSEEKHYYPPYFRQMEIFNTEGAPVIGSLPALRACTPGEVRKLIIEGAKCLDIRSPEAFAGGHIPGSLNIWRDGIPVVAGWMLDYESLIVLIDDFNRDLSTVTRNFARLGYDNIYAYLAGGFTSWTTSGMTVSRSGIWSAEEAYRSLGDDTLFILDVRTQSNREAYGYIPGSHHIYLGELPGRRDEVPSDRPVLVYCDAGRKAGVAVSLLRIHGYGEVYNLTGGMAAWLKGGYPVRR